MSQMSVAANRVMHFSQESSRLRSPDRNVYRLPVVVYLVL